MWGSRKASVSLCMIVRNEARQLAACLEPVADLVDEVVVVDTGSRDETREVARRFTPRVIDFPWCDDFSAARNESLRHARGEWILWLDADDRLDSANVERLRTLFAGLDESPRAYLMETRCVSRFACEGARLITHARLFRRHAELRWRGRVHEQLWPQPVALGYELVWTDVQIDHLGYQDAALWQRKLQRDVRLLRMDYAVAPDDTRTLVHLGLAYFRLGNYREARKHLQRLLAEAPEPSDHLRQVHGALAEMALREGAYSQALETLDHGLAAFPGDEHLLYLRAESLYQLDRYDESRTTLQQLIAGESQPQYRGGVPSDIRQILAPRKLGDVLRLQQQYAAAEQTLRALVTAHPGDTLSWHALGRVYLDTRQRAKLLVVIDQLRACPQGETFGLLLAAACHLAHDELAAAGAAIERLIPLAPQMPLPRILRAEWLAKSGAPVEARKQAFRDILRVQPGHIEAQRLLHELESRSARPAPSAAGSSLPASAWWSSIVVGEGMTERSIDA